jgi:hypothetical protein
MNAATQQRDHVASIASSDPGHALELALKIADPWFRCQALSMAAVHVVDRSRRQRAIDRAFAAANELEQRNRVVTVSAWPVKALVLTGNNARASSEAARLLQIISSEGSPVRRADALRYLLGAVSASTKAVFLRVAQAFAEACLEPLQAGTRNKKGESLLEDCLPGIAQFDRALAESLLARLAPPRSERCARAIEALKDAPVARILSWPHFSQTSG